MATVTARAVLTLLQRHGARLVAGAAGLERPITWACVGRASPPAFGELRGGELALLALGTIAALHAQDGALTLARLEQDLSRRGVAAIAVAGLLGGDAPTESDVAPPSLSGAVAGESRAPAAEEVRLAEALNLPLLSLPAGAPLADIEREVIAAAVAPDPPNAAGTPRGIYDALVRDSLHGDGDQALGRHLAALAKGAVVLGDDHAVRWSAVPPGFSLTREALLNLLRRPSSRAQMRELLNDNELPFPERHDGAPSEIAGRMLAAGFRWWAVPLRPRESTAMLLALVAQLPRAQDDGSEQAGAGAMPDRVDYGAILAQVAPLFTLALARQQDFAGVERQLRAETLDALLAGTYPDEARMRERAAQLGHDLTRPHVALVVARESDLTPQPPSLEGKGESDSSPNDGEGPGERLSPLVDAVTAGAEGAWARERDGEVVVLVPVAADATSGDLAGLAVRLAALCAHAPERWFAGMSEPAVGPAEMRRAAGEAHNTARLGRLVLGPAHVARSADLGIYRLLLRLRETGELETFCRHALGPLLAEGRHSAALLATLDAFFACNGNLSEAARRLDLHRNSLIYRVNRIRELLGHDLEDPELRLTLQLALKARQVLALGEPD